MLPFLELKTTYDTVCRSIIRSLEPTKELIAMAEYFRFLSSNDGAILDNILEEEPALDDPIAAKPYLTKEHLNYIFNEIAPTIVKKLNRERSHDQEYLDACSFILREILLFSIPIMKRKIWNFEFLLAIRSILDYENILHRVHFQISDAEIQKLFTKGSTQQWRTQLKVGDKVDALLHYYDKTRGFSRGAGWSQAQITEIEGEKITINYLLEPKSADRKLDIWSNELAPFESETKDIWAWKATLKVDDLVDCQDDTYQWRPSHIVKFFDLEEDGKTIPMATIGLRVYVETAQRSDERGPYEGFGSRFDEDIPLYSPQITKYRTMSTKDKADLDGELDETLDDFVEAFPGNKRVWTVPRPSKCTSSAFLENLSAFAENGGIALILAAIKDNELSDKAGEFDLNVLACLFSAVSLPALVYHKSVIADFAGDLVKEARKKLLGAPDKALRDMRREAIDAILRACEVFNKRLLPREQRKPDLDELKLDVCLLCMNSSFLQRRIQGISDLSTLIKHCRLQSYTAPDAGKVMIDWIVKNKVIDAVFDPAKTHLQIVQRCDELIKLLSAEDELTDERLSQFWALTKTEMRLDIYKIVSDCAFGLKQPHLEFIFDKICNGIPAAKLDMEDFNCLSELGRCSRDREAPFHKNVTKFFWRIATGGDHEDPVGSLEVIEHCSTKYREMIKYNTPLEKKQEMCIELVRLIKEGNLTSSVACIQLLQGIIKDQNDRVTTTSNYNYGSTTYSYGGGSSTYPPPYGTGSALRGAGQGTQGAVGAANDPQDDRGDDEDKKEDEKPKELTLQQILSGLSKDHHIMDVLLANLAAYSNKVVAQLSKSGKPAQADRKNLFIGNSVHSHHDEIDKRLDFIKFYAQVNEDYCVSQKELGVIYDLLVTKSPVGSDEQEFLSWCKSSCESQSTKASILDMQEVGHFFTDKIQRKELDLKNLGPTGFDFLKQYFLSVNKGEEKIEEVKPKVTTSYGGYGTASGYRGGVQTSYGGGYRYSWSADGGYGSTSYGTNNNQEKEKKYNSKVLPKDLLEYNMLWTLVLECQHAEVADSVVAFFIQMHLQLVKELETEKQGVLLELIQRCMDILVEKGQSAEVQRRVIAILKSLINETEAQGASTITPHGALMKGEPCEVTVKNQKVTESGGELKVQVCSNTTLWDLKVEVAAVLDFAPQYIQFEVGKTMQTRTSYSDRDNGKTMKQLGISGGEYFVASKQLPEETIQPAALLNADGSFTRDAERVFEMLFDMYAEDDGTWSKQSTYNFILGCVGEKPNGDNAEEDKRVEGLFETYDTDRDGKLQMADFFAFYATASRDRKGVVMDNLRNFNVRPDLKRWSDVASKQAAKKEELPRYILSTHQEHFEKLMAQLDAPDSHVSSEVWELVQMLATNQTYYKRVLTLDNQKDGQFEWKKLFDKSHAYNLLYSLQIVQAVIADGSDDSRRAVCLNTEEFFTARLSAKKYLTAEEVTALEAEKKEGEEIEKTQKLNTGKKAATVIGDGDGQELTTSWAHQFVMRGGFKFILEDFMTCSLESSSAHEENIDQKYIAFMLQVMRTFLMAALASNDLDAYKVAKLARKESNASQSNEPAAATEEDDETAKKLQEALAGQASDLIMSVVDYEKLQSRIIAVIAHSLLKGNSMMFEDKIIIENALQLWVGCLQHNSNLFEAFVSSKLADNLTPAAFLTQGLLYCTHESVREEFKILLANLCRGQSSKAAGPSSPLQFTVKLLTDHMSNLSGQPSAQYIDLFVLVLQQVAIRAKVGAVDINKLINCNDLLSLIIDTISAENLKVEQIREESKAGKRDPMETGALLTQSSDFLLGLMTLAGEVLDTFDGDEDDKLRFDDKKDANNAQREGLINEIFTRYLFPMVFGSNGKDDETSMRQVIEQKMISKTQGAKSTNSKKTQSSVAYKVLLGLVRRDASLMNYFVKECLNPVVYNDKLQRAEIWQYSPPATTVRKAEYVGLRNPGCICYMNSMNQQFFMVPPLRYNILAVDDGKPEDYKMYKGDSIDDNMLHQFQTVMANLELGQGSDYLPKGYCFAFKDDGQPTNTAEQKDAQEYLTAVFDRLEFGLKNTSRKYLVKSIFGLQTCSQLICKDGCGRVKNRLEEAYNLSLTVKDLKGISQSLQAQCDGEVISDYECSGCKKKVDIHKRTLITETPNVLIVHLQRILFDFNTFQNEKMNQYFEFPHELDLTPYSYHAVMEKEGRLPKEEGEPAEEAKKGDEEGEEEEPNPEPIEDDCFEYTLAGVTVHSGTANAGHYWSLISTERDGLRPNSDAPVDHLNAKWMEFNDSLVREWEVTQLKKETFGGEQSSAWGGGNSIGISSFGGAWSIGGGGGSYGQSGYMLVYERKKKKPLKLCRQVPTDEPVEEGKEPATKEEVYEIDYGTCVEPTDKPNKIFNNVLEQNAKYVLEQEVYQPEFVDFLYGIQKAIAGLDSSDEAAQELRREAIRMANKATLEIYASAGGCSKVLEAFTVLAEVMHQDKTMTLHKEFLQAWWDADKFSYLTQLLIDNPDIRPRNAFNMFMRYLLVNLKFAEKDYLGDGEEYTVHGDNGTSMIMEQEKSLAARFIMHVISLLNTKGAKHPDRIEQFTETLVWFALAEPKDVNAAIFGSETVRVDDLDSKTDGARLGLTFFAKKQFLRAAADFLLGSKSPLCAPGEKRFDTGYGKATVDGNLVHLITVLMEDAEIQKAYPLADQEKMLLQHPALLKSVLGSPRAATFANFMAEMCRDDYKLSKKIIKMFLRAIEGAVAATVGNYLNTIKPFLLINDSLKRQRLEWALGVSDHRSQKAEEGAGEPQYGIDMIKHVNEEVLIYECPVLHPDAQFALVSQILKAKGRHDAQCIACLKELTALMCMDEDVTRYLFNLQPVDYATARFTDWIKPYLLQQQADHSKNQYQKTSYMTSKLEDINEALANLEKRQPLFDKLLEEQMTRMKKAIADKNEYSNMADMKWPALANPTGEVIQHFPPQLVVGKLTTAEEVYYAHDEDPTVLLELRQVCGEYAYGAPTGNFNLTVPTMKKKALLSYQPAESYAQYRQKLKEQEHIAEGKTVDEQSTSATETEADAPLGIDEKYWENNKQVGPLFLRVQVDFKERNKDVKFWYKISSKSGNEDNINVILPETRRKVHLSHGHKKLCESIRIKDPSKGYFFKDKDDIKIELEVIVRNDLTNVRRGIGATAGGVTSGIGMGTSFQRTGGKSVQISDQVETNYYGHDEDDDGDYGLGGNDEARYAAWQDGQSGAQGDGYTVTNFDAREMENVLALGMGSLEPQDGVDRRSNSSTEAVMMNNDIQGEIGGDVGGVDVQTDPARCPNCQKQVSVTDDACPECMTWLGGGLN